MRVLITGVTGFAGSHLVDYLLADTDAFGPRMEILGSYPLWHGDLGADTNQMGADWLEVLLAPTTDLELNGSIEVISSDDRSYLVSADSGFSFFFILSHGAGGHGDDRKANCARLRAQGLMAIFGLLTSAFCLLTYVLCPLPSALCPLQSVL